MGMAMQTWRKADRVQKVSKVMHLIKPARLQKVSEVMHFIKWLNAHRTREGEHQKVRYVKSYRKYRAVKGWHDWFMAGRYASDKGISMATEDMDRLRTAKHFRRIRQHCSDTRARELMIR